MTTTGAPGGTAAAAPRKKDKTHYLYIAVIVAVALGIAVGLARPRVRRRAEAARHRLRQPHQDDDPADHLLHARARRRLGAQAAKVGKVGGLALGYFIVMSTVALAIGLVVGNILHPGSGLHITPDTSAAGAAQAAEGHGSTTEFLLGIIPTAMVSAFTSGIVLQTLLVALLVGFALQAHGPLRRADPARRRAPPAPRLPDPLDDHVGGPGRRLRRDRGGRRRDRRGRAQEPRGHHDRLLRHLRPLRLRRARHAAAARRRRQHLPAAASTWAASSC